MQNHEVEVRLESDDGDVLSYREEYVPSTPSFALKQDLAWYFQNIKRLHCTDS